jgi:hypothetical protein
MPWRLAWLIRLPAIDTSCRARSVLSNHAHYLFSSGDQGPFELNGPAVIGVCLSV